jgi:hypothetical protein
LLLFIKYHKSIVCRLKVIVIWFILNWWKCLSFSTYILNGLNIISNMIISLHFFKNILLFLNSLNFILDFFFIRLFKSNFFLIFHKHLMYLFKTLQILIRLWILSSSYLLINNFFPNIFGQFIRSLKKIIKCCQMKLCLL